MSAGVVVVDYGSGNIRSAEKALARAASTRGLSIQVQVSSNPDIVRQADRVVLPGVGAFADCMKGLNAVDGLKDALFEVAVHKARPFLGICVGMQLMAEWGLEHGRHQGFGWIQGSIEPLTPKDEGLKIPHMGWNALSIEKPHALLEDVTDGTHMYFVHSYALSAAQENVVATSDYGGPFGALVICGNKVGMQFHPEKSQRAGLHILGNFLDWQP